MLQPRERRTKHRFFFYTVGDRSFVRTGRINSLMDELPIHQPRVLLLKQALHPMTMGDHEASLGKKQDLV